MGFKEAALVRHDQGDIVPSKVKGKQLYFLLMEES